MWRQPLLLLLILPTSLAWIPFSSFSLVPPPRKVSSTTASESVVRTYEHDGWTLSYRFKPATKGYESADPLLLVHPVGVGLSSWFWEKLNVGPATYAVDLIGCGKRNGGDVWNPEERGLSIPLGWVQACEALMQQEGQKAFWRPTKRYNVVVQGGLAPVGVLLAARNPSTVERLILTSPPTWKDITTAVPESELEKNYNFLRSKALGGAAFAVLESRLAVETFSNLFLFDKPCGREWLDRVAYDTMPEARPPVQAFNAGFCMHRSYETELRELTQPVLVLEGREDKNRLEGRQEYAQKMPDCTNRIIPGKNVLPWESPDRTADEIREFCGY